jgi:hypothetical protein
MIRVVFTLLIGSIVALGGITLVGASTKILMQFNNQSSVDFLSYIGIYALITIGIMLVVASLPFVFFKLMQKKTDL